MAGLRGFGAGLDGTEGGETEEGACRLAPAAHTGLEEAFHAKDRDIWREKDRKRDIEWEKHEDSGYGSKGILAYYILTVYSVYCLLYFQKTA